MMKNETKDLFWLSFYSLFGAWKFLKDQSSKLQKLNQNKISLFL